jgi:hypothetical protein
MHFFLLYTVLSAAFTLACTPIIDPAIYMIRHGEKPSNGDNGLNAQGLERAQCLRSVFGRKSEYNIGYIMANTPLSSMNQPRKITCRRKSNKTNTDGKRARPLETVLPLAVDLGLTVDTSCDRNDYDCVKKVIAAYTGPGNILISWEHDALMHILEMLGVEDAPDYPHDRLVFELAFCFFRWSIDVDFDVGLILSGLFRRHTRISRRREVSAALGWIIESCVHCNLP